MLKPMPFRYPDDPIRQYIESSFVQDLMAKEPGNWIAQHKNNGWRRGAYRMGLWSLHAKRSQEPSKNPPQDLMEEFADLKIPDGTALDMEWMGLRDTGYLAGRHWFEVFDLLYWKSEWQGAVPLIDRWKRLQDIFSPLKSKRIFLMPTYELDKVDLFVLYERLKKEYENRDRDAKKEGAYCEGLVVKGRQSQLIGDFRSAKKNPSWMKIKYREI